MGKSVFLGCLVAVLVGVLIVGGLAVGAYNRLNTADQAVNGSWADVENNYQRRADLVPNLVETVKGAAAFEKSTLEAVVQARASATQVRLDANAIKDPEAFARFQQAQDGLSSALSRLLVTVEKYPELKANQNFRDLQVQLEGTENRIAVSRNRFNEATQAYNTLRKSFPTVIVASFAGFKERPYFKSAAGAERAPAVKF
ncbi:MAG TPA: LemA family protein [Thermoanaerobaculia bacterium]|nr:LemA family protein [Thermoanaerobaculia bacterium]